VKIKLGAVSAAIAMLSASPAQGQYENGFVWRFSTDYGAGTLQGASIGYGNPQSDAAGRTPWSYEWVAEGLALSGSPPWYRGHSTLMTWDPSYFGFPGFPRWSKANDAGASLQIGYVEHYVFVGADRSAPVIRWTNPLGRTITVEVRDALQLHWLQGTTAVIEVALAKFSVASASHSLLYSASRPRPAIPGPNESENLEVAPMMVSLDAGDSLAISIRAIGTGTCYVGLDTNLRIMLVTGGECPVDSNADRQITFADVLAVLANFGAVCP